MRINTNLSALNAYRNLSMTDNRLNKSLERLSSGLRINRAADDAAGLAISEKMRGQIRGLNQAMRNAMDGISLMQTAEGALNETHAILQRMRELSVQAASDTLTSSDRIEIQREIEQLTAEMNRIASSTEFNTKKLLDGSSAALTSTSDLNTRIIMRDGLRIVDQFGQKAVGGGNYRLDVSAIAGQGEVQKTDIMKVKHDSGAYDVEVTQDASLLGLEETQDYAAATASEVEGTAHAVGTDVSGAAQADVIITVGETVFTADLSSWDGSGDETALIAALHGADDGAGNTLDSVVTISGNGTLLTITHDTLGAEAITVTYAGDDGTVEGNLATLTGIEADATDTGTDLTPEIRTLNLGGADGGTFTLGDGTNSTDPLAYDITAADLKAAIEGLTLIEENVTVTGEDGSFIITFDAAEGASGLTFDGSSLENAATVNEQQTITLTGAIDGTFTLTVDGETTGSIAYDASATAVQTAINDALDDGNKTVTVTGSAGAWVVEFSGTDFAGEDQTLIVMNTSGIEGIEGIGEIAKSTTAINDIDRFWDANGNFLLEDPQTVNIVQGDGKKTSITIFGSDTIQDVEDKMNRAIHEGLEQRNYNSDGSTYVRFVTRATAMDNSEGFFTVAGTYVIQSAVTGSDGELRFSGNEGIINALSLTTIQKSVENQFTVDVHNAHTEEELASGVRIAGNHLVGVVHPNVDIKFNPMAGITVDPSEMAFQWDDSGDVESIFIHLSDNTMVFHIGANPLQDVSAAIGDMSAEALGVNNILVTNRGSANRAISQIDYAIGRVSSERAKLGAVQNRLEHTINNLGVAAENLAAAESRVRDLDFALEMVEFTRNQIMMQAGTSMLAQANMKPQSVLMLLQ